jgi:hypothetical protein
MGIATIHPPDGVKRQSRNDRHTCVTVGSPTGFLTGSMENPENPSIELPARKIEKSDLSAVLDLQTTKRSS